MLGSLEHLLQPDLYRQIVDASPAGIALIRGSGNHIAYANQEFYRLVGKHTGAVEGRSLLDVLPDCDPAFLEEARRSSVAIHCPIVLGPDAATWWDFSFLALADTDAGTASILLTAQDVTRHVLARRDAEAAAAALDALMAHIPEGVTIARGPGVHVERVSAHGAAMAKRSANELTGSDVLLHPEPWQVHDPGTLKLIPPDERPLARAIRNGEVTVNEILMLGRPDGSMVPVLCNSGPIRDADGRITGGVLAWRDVSDLHQAQAACIHNEQRLRAVLKQVPAAMFILEAPDGRISLQSNKVDEVLGHSGPGMRAARESGSEGGIHADGTPYKIEEYPSHRALRTGEIIEAEAMIYRRGDGRLIDLEIYAGPVREDGEREDDGSDNAEREDRGAIVAAVAAAFDVTQRKRAEELLREGEERFRVALEAGGLGTFELDLLTRQARFGAGLADMLGLPSQVNEIDRPLLATFIHPDDLDKVLDGFAQAVASGDTYLIEFRVRTPETSVRWLVSQGRILRASDGRPLQAVGVMRDVTQRRLREDRLREALAARELLFREADHRIKNSLQLVGGLLRLQRSRLSDPDAIAALDDSIARVMAVSETHKALHKSADLRHVAFGGMLSDLCTHAGELNPLVNFVCVSTEIELDTERAIPLGLIVSELLTNAAKYAYPAGGGEVRAAAITADEFIEITISDRGMGMPPGRAESGLGSTIVNALARQINAEILLTTTPGGGTSATLRVRHADPGSERV